VWWTLGYRPVNMEACEGTVQPAGEIAQSKTVASSANRPSSGVVSFAYPYMDIRSTRWVSSTRRMIFGFLFVIKAVTIGRLRSVLSLSIVSRLRRLNHATPPGRRLCKTPRHVSRKQQIHGTMVLLNASESGPSV